MTSDLPDFLTEGDGFVDITLSRPADIGGARVSTLRMREMNGNDVLVNDKRKGSEAEKEFAMLADLCEVTPADIGKLPVKDIKRLQRASQVFTD